MQGVGYACIVSRLKTAMVLRRSKPAHNERFDVSDFVAAKFATPPSSKPSETSCTWNACQQALGEWFETFPEPETLPGELC
jgi:hypothetical protein